MEMDNDKEMEMDNDKEMDKEMDKAVADRYIDKNKNPHLGDFLYITEYPDIIENMIKDILLPSQ